MITQVITNIKNGTATYYFPFKFIYEIPEEIIHNTSDTLPSEEIGEFALFELLYAMSKYYNWKTSTMGDDVTHEFRSKIYYVTADIDRSGEIDVVTCHLFC